MGEQEVDQEKESLKENLAGAQAGLDRANQNLENHLKTSPDNTFFDAYNQNVQDYKASHETPEQAAARQRDQRNAAMWTAVTDGINHIFNLTNASTNKNAVPMQTVSTSQAIQKSAKENDERYEKSQEKLMEMNRNLDSMRMGRYSLASDNLSKLRDIHALQVANAQGRLDKHNEGVRSQRDFDEGVRQFNANMDFREKELEYRKNNDSANRSHESSMQQQRIDAQSEENEKNRQHDTDMKNSNLTPAEKEKAAQRDIQSSYDALSPEAKARVDSNMQKFKNEKNKAKKNVSDKEYYDELKKCIEQDNRNNGGKGTEKEKFFPE